MANQRNRIIVRRRIQLLRWASPISPRSPCDICALSSLLCIPSGRLAKAKAFLGEKVMPRLAAISVFTLVGALIGGTVAVSAGWFDGLFGAGNDDPFAQCRASAVAGGSGQIGGPFTLVNGEGETVSDQDVITQPSLVYFGYTYCPDVCPFDVARNVIAVDILEEQGLDVTPVFISIDPERDTPDVVAQYAQDMHPKMIGLTGSAEQVKAASQAYKTYYARGTGEGEFYLMDHSTFTYLMFPETGLASYFGRDVT